MDGLPDWAVDDAEVAGSIRLLRRVHPMLIHSGKIEKGVFADREAGCGLSVTIWESPSDLDDIIRRHEDFCVVCVPASAFREFGVVIARHPLVGNLNHCEIFPALTGGQQKRLRAASQFVRYADDVPAEYRAQLVEF